MEPTTTEMQLTNISLLLLATDIITNICVVSVMGVRLLAAKEDVPPCEVYRPSDPEKQDRTGASPSDAYRQVVGPC